MPVPSGGSRSRYKVENEGNNRENQQQVDQGSSDMENCETANPRDEQHHEQYSPDTHRTSNAIQLEIYETRWR
jgi:hypothetical protein